MRFVTHKTHKKSRAVRYAAGMTTQRSNGARRAGSGRRSGRVVAIFVAATALGACNKERDTGTPEAVASSAAKEIAQPQQAAGEPEKAPSAGPDHFCTLPFQEGSAPSGYQGVTKSAKTGDACLACESKYNKCPHDPAGCDKGACSAQPSCDDYQSDAQKTACMNVRRCVRQTNCIGNGVSSCFCGNTDIAECTGTPGPKGPCKDSIVAGFAKGTTPADILAHLNDVNQPAGGAMALAQCDHDGCATECIPYCK